jgi:hypothetical protein
MWRGIESNSGYLFGLTAKSYSKQISDDIVNTVFDRAPPVRKGVCGSAGR